LTNVGCWPALWYFSIIQWYYEMELNLSQILQLTFLILPYLLWALQSCLLCLLQIAWPVPAHSQALWSVDLFVDKLLDLLKLVCKQSNLLILIVWKLQNLLMLVSKLYDFLFLFLTKFFDIQILICELYNLLIIVVGKLRMLVY
jgi:hypothetical protein